jgi:hypothetical protein
MPRGGKLSTHTRRLMFLAVAFFCAGAASAQSQPTSQPATQPAPAPETVLAARQRLNRIKPHDRTPAERTLLVALDFALAVTQSDPKRANAVVDATGYQTLPLAGELPEKPAKPLLAPALEREILGLPRADLARLNMDRVEIVPHEKLRDSFPAVATWMLPQDFAVVFRAAPADQVSNWLAQDACLVVRIRGERATVLGGSLLQALGDAAESRAPEAEEK